MNNRQPRLTLDRPVIYRVIVPGELDATWVDRAGGLTVAVKRQGDDPPATILTGTLDQAALHSLLHRLYTLGIPLISVRCLSLD